MAVVLADPAGFAVDWNWQRRLTVWTFTGRRYEPQFDRQVIEHELPDGPTSRRQAHAAARSWWQAQGRTQVLTALSESAGRPGN